MDTHDIASFTTLCQAVKSLCTKALEKSDFLLFVNDDAARVVRSELRSIIAETNMVEALVVKGLKATASEDADATFLALAPEKADAVRNRIETCEHYLSTALKSTTPDTKATNLANILCQSPYLAPSTSLFNAVIEELREHRRSIPEELKRALKRELSGFHSEPGDLLGPMLSGRSESDQAVDQNELSNPKTWENWLELRVAKLDSPSTMQLLAIQNQLFAQLWTGLSREIISAGQSLSSDICESGDRLDTQLRDALARRFSSRYTMAFVGMQSSGKSTFLNSFLGKDMLPSHARPTTTYPCRIRHVAGKVVPELHLPKSLEFGVSCLRKFNWLEKYKGYSSVPPTWTGHDLPVNVKASSLIKAWKGLGQITRESYSMFVDPSFSLPAVIYGESGIKSWLQRINDLTSLCQSFRLPFESFLFDDWAVIMCEYLEVPHAPTDGFCEIIDIPGLDDYHTWDEVIHEVIRSANAVVAVVSLYKFDSRSWEPTAALLSRTTNLSIAAVILTKADSARDEAPAGQDEDPQRVVAKAFWNMERGSPEFKGLILPCSIVGGNAATALLSLIEQEGEKPSFDRLLQQPYLGYWGFQNLTAARSGYANLTLQGLTIQCKDRVKRLNVDYTFKTLHGIINNRLSKQLLSEIAGIDSELRSMKEQISVSKMRAPVPLGRTITIKGEKILQEWSRLQRNVHEDIEALISASPLPEADVESTARDAISFALEELVHSSTIVPSVDFDEVQALETFVTGVQRAFASSLSTMSENKMQQLLKDSRESIVKGISAMQKCVESLQSQPYYLVRPPWPAVKQLHPHTEGDLMQKSDIMHKNRRLLHGSYAFYEWRRRIQLKFSTSLGYPSEASGLSRFQRVMVAVAAAITFPIRNIVGIHQTQFVLDLGVVQKSLEEIGEEYWEGTLIKTFRKTLQSENDPIWEAAHVAIMMALAGFPDEMEGEGVIESSPPPDILKSSLTKINTMISANLGCLQLLASRLESTVVPPESVTL